MKSDNVSRELHEVSQDLFAVKLEVIKQHSRGKQEVDQKYEERKD